MTIRQSIADWSLCGAAFGAGILAIRHYRHLGAPENAALDCDLGHVTVIVPARNEEHRIRPLLLSLRRLTYPDVEVVVVDDGSEDRTAALSAGIGARVVKAGQLPPGWTGKCHACARGAAETGGEWILFTDADTRHEPDSLSIALRAAQTERLDFVSFLARQQCETLWENLLLPYAYFGYFVGAVVGPSNPLLNGQYILCRRSEYDRIGGHAAVHDSVIEDVDLGRRAVSQGARIVLLRGERWVSVRMYDSPGALWQGFAKNAVLFVRLNPLGGLATGLAGLVFLTAPVRAVRSNSWKRQVSVGLAPALALGAWRGALGLSAGGGLLYALPAVIFQLIALDSLAHVLSPGRASWKGRRY